MVKYDEPDIPQTRMVAAPLDEAQAERLKHAFRVIERDDEDYEVLSDYFEGDQVLPYIPTSATEETYELRKRSVLNLMPLAVQIHAQVSFVEGFRRGTETVPDEWHWWEKNGMAAKQTILYKATLKYGQGYAVVENFGAGKPRMKVYSTRDTVAMFEDPVNDVVPQYLVSIRSRPLSEKSPGRAVYMDDEVIQWYHLTLEKEFIPDGDPIRHGRGVCPAVRYVCEIDDVGRVRGIIEPLITVQDAINQAKFLMMTNLQYSSFKVRWAAGLHGEPRVDENGVVLRDKDGQILYQPIAVTPKRFLSTEAPDAKFGTLDETPVDGFVNAFWSEVKQFAIAGQLPPHSLLGNLSNLSAETLVAAMGQTMRNAHVLKTSWSESHEALMRLVAIDLGIVTADDDYNCEVAWRDMSDQTFGGQVDGLGKGAQMLGIPGRALWERFPGATPGQIEEWERVREKEDERAQQQLEQQALNAPDPFGAARREKRPTPKPRSTDGDKP